MKCNACWRELEGRAVSTTCGHLFCTEDASKILSTDAACPICDQVLSRSLMKAVDVNPSDEWTNMAMIGVSPQVLMRSAYQSVRFCIKQKELEMQYKMNSLMAQCRQKCESMQEKYNEKLQQLHMAYQKTAKKCQMLEQETESLSKDKQELQEKFSEKSRQKRKLEEMYDNLRHEHESVKRMAIQPAKSFYPRHEPDLFSNPSNMMDRDTIKKDWSVFPPGTPPGTPGHREDIWGARQNSSNSGQFEISGGSPAKQTMSVDPGSRTMAPQSRFGSGVSNASATIRNIIFSPVKRPQLSRSRPQLFTL